MIREMNPGLRRRRRAADDGFTLVEVLVALSLVTVALLGMLFALATDVKGQGVEKAQTTAIHLANSTLESAAGIAYSSLCTTAVAPSDATNVTGPATSGSNHTTTSTVPASASDSGIPYSVTAVVSGNCTSNAATSATVTVNYAVHGSSHAPIVMSQSFADGSTVTSTGNPLTFLNCWIRPLGVLNGLVVDLQLLSVVTKTSNAETLQCLATGLSTSDSLSVSYVQGASTQVTQALTTTNGVTWTWQMPKGTQLKNLASGLLSLPLVSSLLGVTETFKFTATRASDSKTFTSSQTLTLEALA